MHILICNERFLFRFGADRVLLLLAKGFHSAGHRITLMGNRVDAAVVGPFSNRFIQVPDGNREYLHSNEATAKWLEQSLPDLFEDGDCPDLVIVGGWPFFASLPILKRFCSRVLFIDFGAVPLDGYSGGALTIQNCVRTMRQTYLKHASSVIAISDFIRRTQSATDTKGLIPCHSILLAADHVDSPLWSVREVSMAAEAGLALRTVEDAIAQGKKPILNLGRWEPGCYKNSEEAYELLRKVRLVVPEVVLVILAGTDLDIPADVRSWVLPIGFPDDAELAAVMTRVDAGISVSRWEGFNLPVAEMQWLGRPALAYDVGAHPEVIVDPWYLAANVSEMANKAVRILTQSGYNRNFARGLETFRSRFTWSRVVAEYRSLIEQSQHTPVVIVDVSNSAIDGANTGVIRVTRRLCRELQNIADPVFVVWDASLGSYVFPTSEEYAQLGQFNGPLAPQRNRMSPSGDQRVPLHRHLHSGGDGWLLFTETIRHTRFQDSIRYARGLGLGCCAVFYDAIPVLRPELCNDETVVNHSGYMKELAQCDLVIPISEFSASCLRQFWAKESIEGARVVANPLPGEFGGSPRATSYGTHGARIRILCVSTLEPRKNHRRLIEACEMLGRRHTGLDWTLTLVGNRYAGGSELAAYVESVAQRNPRIRWLGVIDDAALQREYTEATFCVYPSLIEGFGLPIVESIWHGRPCICADTGVMAELAADGGCLTTNVEDEEALSRALERLSLDSQLWTELSRQALARPVKSWTRYTEQFLLALDQKAGSDSVTGTRTRRIALTHPTDQVNPQPLSWEERLYPGCFRDSWQMNDSERLGLSALLARLKPTCSVEVGTYYGGSLSLISQYSTTVVSIDTDPEVATRFAPLPNVHYLSGDSRLVLPSLLKKLAAAGVGVDFILIDGDHTAEGVQKDISTVLDYVPLNPLFVLLHDSFNPNCRRGMLQANWGRSLYCQAVELDFVPGRVIEHGGPTTGELWGGLAMGYFTPERRHGALIVRQSAEKMFRLLTEAPGLAAANG